MDENFDPMLLQVLVEAPNREACIENMKASLKNTIIFGVQTNINHVLWTLEQKVFEQSTHHIKWLEENLESYKSYVDALDTSYAERLIQKAENGGLNFVFDPWDKNPLPKFSTKPYIQKDSMGTWWIQLEGLTYHFKRRKPSWDQMSQASEHSLLAPMTSKVTKIYVQKASRVQKGETLMSLEAMKMEHRITAHRDGEIKHIFCKEGQTVDKDFLLMEFEA